MPTLPKGIIHEAHIKFQNGQWFLSINYWKPPVPAPDPDTRIVAGAVDTGINPLATDSEGQTWENPKAREERQDEELAEPRFRSRLTTSSGSSPRGCGEHDYGRTWYSASAIFCPLSLYTYTQ